MENFQGPIPTEAILAMELRPLLVNIIPQGISGSVSTSKIFCGNVQPYLWKMIHICLFNHQLDFVSVVPPITHRDSNKASQPYPSRMVGEMLK